MAPTYKSGAKQKAIARARKAKHKTVSYVNDIPQRGMTNGVPTKVLASTVFDLGPLPCSIVSMRLVRCQPSGVEKLLQQHVVRFLEWAPTKKRG